MRGVPGGEVIWLHPFRSTTAVLAHYFPPRGWIGNYYSDYDVYTKYGCTVLGSVKFWGAIPTFWVSDPEALRVILNNRNVFRRDVQGYEVVGIYGPNIAAIDGEAWKRHRSVAKPAFDESNNILVWRHTTRVVSEWFEALSGEMQGRTSVEVDLLKDCTEASLDLALLVFLSAAFGKHSSWSDHSGDNPGHHTPFRLAATSAINNLIPRILIPDRLFALVGYLPLPTTIKEIRDSFESFKLHMLDIINASRDWIASGHDSPQEAALLQNLVKANLAQLEQEETKELTKRRLTDEEMLSNALAFLLAGHETSAHSICFALCLMALYPDVQGKIYQETKKLWPSIKDMPNGETVTTVRANSSSYDFIVNMYTSPQSYKEDMAKLEYTTAVFRETLRLFPPVPRTATPVFADAVLTSHLFKTNSEGKMETTQSHVNVPAGSLVVIDILGVHKNPICWGTDAEDFNPEHFIDTETYTWPRDAFMAFSAGARSCMGERFGMVESICTLAHIARKFKVVVPDHLAKRPWTEQKRVLLSWSPMLTLTPHNASVCFTPREHEVL
ncbi:hypothetical protein VKT23_010772 [Stygiomarasmius scandens]|uniref:Cytochrome P450 n=1 Tax=Marasmiellus scandens TaxID=2682957 RepID=A0ABR1JA60_9AGAR